MVLPEAPAASSPAFTCGGTTRHGSGRSASTRGQIPGIVVARRIGVVVHGNGGLRVFERQPERWLDYSGKAVELKL
jgi:hypothetical protein